MITVLGIGPGNDCLLLNTAMTHIETADSVIGSRRQLEIVPEHFKGEKLILPKKLGDLENYLLEHLSRQIVVLASGDPLLYGIGNWIGTKFSSEHYQIIPGISAIHYMFSQLRLSMNDTYFTSSHGKLPNYELIFSLPKVGMVTDSKIVPYQLAKELSERGIHKTIYVGENLSYPNERIRKFNELSVPDEQFEMNVVVLVDE